MNIPSINVVKNGCWQSPECSTKSIPRFVQRYELEYLLDDGGETWIDGVHYKLSKGCAVFCTPGQMRFSRFPFKVKYLYVEVLSEDSNFADFLLCQITLLLLQGLQGLWIWLRILQKKTITNSSLELVQSL